MAVYTTSSNIQKRVKPMDLAQVIYDATDLGAITTDAKATTALADATATAIVTQAITDASTLIDSYLQGHADMTVAANQTKVEQRCADIALYYLFRRRYMDNERNPYYVAFLKAEKWCQDIASGKLRLGVGPETPDNRTYSNTASTDKTLTSDSLEGF